MGAQLLRVERLEAAGLGVTMPARYNLMNRSRPAVPVDLRRPEGVELVLDLCAGADALFEGFRPGVMERLGLGPAECMARNPRLVYGRMTGWGQEGPLAERAGHDPNYIALAGVLASIGERDGPPIYPLNLVGDFGGGGAFLAIGLLAGIIEASRSGAGQVVDAAMVDGAASLMTVFHGLLAAGLWREQRGSNLLDGGAPFLRPYETADGKYVVVGALEGKFFRELLARLGLDDLDPDWQYDPGRWPEIRQRLAEAFASRKREEWMALFEHSDACVSPVLSLSEATRHPHNVARETYVEKEGILQPAPAPRFSRTRSAIGSSPGADGKAAAEALAQWGVPAARVRSLAESGVLRVEPG